MRTAAAIAILLAGSVAAFAAPRPYQPGVVEKVVWLERSGAAPVELTDSKALAPAPGFVYLTVRSGKTRYTASYYAYRTTDYPLNLRPGQPVRYRISQEQVIECDVHAVMTMRSVMQMTLRSPKGHLWPLEIGPVLPPISPPVSLLPAPGTTKK